MNPYEVLGVSESSTNEEIRSAYLKLVKKYHPDRYQDNPLKNLADEKLKEINEAYDIITKQRSGGGQNASGGYRNTSGSYSYGSSGGSSYGASGGSYYGASGGAYSGPYAAEFQRVRQCLNSQSLREAAAILDGIPVQNAEWHYLYGIVYFRSGEYSFAYDHLSQATNMEPNNVEYRQAFTMLNSRGSRGYHSYGGRNSSDGVNTACNICTTLLCADACCECMGGDLIGCC